MVAAGVDKTPTKECVRRTWPKNPLTTTAAVGVCAVFCVVLRAQQTGCRGEGASAQFSCSPADCSLSVRSVQAGGVLAQKSPGDGLNVSVCWAVGRLVVSHARGPKTGSTIYYLSSKGPQVLLGQQPVAHVVVGTTAVTVSVACCDVR